MTKCKYGSFSREDCLALLSYVAAHREPMSLTSLAEGAGIPRTTLNLILMDANTHGQGSLLAEEARKYHFEWSIDRREMIPGLRSKGPKGQRKIIDVEKRGYGD